MTATRQKFVNNKIVMRDLRYTSCAQHMHFGFMAKLM